MGWGGEYIYTALRQIYSVTKALRSVMQRYDALRALCYRRYGRYGQGNR